jgi:hypothetical protein
MKGILLGFLALTMVASGMTAVSAYEAHALNVKAHVENAIALDAYHINYGTVFPQEWLLKEFHVQTSVSFCAQTQTRVNAIDYAIWAEWKENPAGGYYPWLGDAMYVGVQVPADQKKPVAAGGSLVPVGPNPPPGPPGAIHVLDDSLLKPTNNIDLITLGLDVPVFEGYYNELTDALVNGGIKPSGLTRPTVILTGARNVPDGIDLGVDIKIQVTNISKK